jgi:hypothetical protein
MSWFNSGSNLKSLGELDRLVNVVLSDDFKKEDLVGFSAKRESERLDNYDNDPTSRLLADDGWIETSVSISVPAEHVRHASETDAPRFEVPGLFYRRPLEVLKAALQEESSAEFHLFPHRIF